MKHTKKAFTIIEILVGILIVSIVLISGFQAYSLALAGKVRLIEKTKLQKDTIFFIERLFQTIKQGGTIDYEEYFNRKVVGTDQIKGHYKIPTGFGNFGRCTASDCNPSTGNLPTDKVSLYGDLFYYCRSDYSVNPPKLMEKDKGCYTGGGLMSNIKGAAITPGASDPQRYGQYSFQFWDYKTDLDNNNSIVGDDDDYGIGNGPRVFPSGSDVRELYLISGNKKTRTYFRYNVEKDTNAPSGTTCNFTTITGEACLGTIEYLVLQGRDWGMDHNSAIQDATQNDGVIDTWVVDKRFSGKTDEVAGTYSTNGYWKRLFPENINVMDFKVHPYPNIEEARAWNLDTNEVKQVKFSPYVILSIKIRPSWKVRKHIKGDPKPMRFNTTINLTDIFSK